MSETWGPRAHPERCNDELERAHQRMESSWSRFVWGVLILFALGTWAYLWWTGG